ncbi:MAG: hypothetical protein HYY30_00380 [Chloroflexi bacterium]|nr:hypothetical protein [Chloroflexota bacterium]
MHRDGRGSILVITDPGHNRQHHRGLFAGQRLAHLSKVLSRSFALAFATPEGLEFSIDDGVRDSEAARSVAPDAGFGGAVDAVFVDGRVLRQVPSLIAVTAPIVVDLYDPLIADDPSQWPGPIDPAARAAERETMIREQLLVGDFFLCANEAQRDYWLGMLTVYGRVNPLVYADDKTLGNLLAVVPWGIERWLSEADSCSLADLPLGIREGDMVVAWALDDLPWLDPVTLVHAVADLVQSTVALKILFLVSPRSDWTRTGIVAAAKNASDLRQLTDRHAFFINCATGDLNRYLRQADLGISLQKDCFAARFAVRPEIEAYVGAGLPVLATPNNAQVISRFPLGWVVSESTVEQVVRSLREFLAAPDLRKALDDKAQKAASELSWEVTSLPLVRWCELPRRAPDRPAGSKHDLPRVTIDPTLPSFWAMPGRALYYLKVGGVAGLAAEMRSYLRGKLPELRR